MDELRDSAHDRIQKDFGALLGTIRKLRELAENRQDAELDSIAFDLKMHTCRLANTATLKMYIEDCDEIKPS